MIDLSNVTLWTCYWSDRTDEFRRIVRMLHYCQHLARFGRTILFSHFKPPCAVNADCIQIPKMDFVQWNIFHNKMVPAFIQTYYALAVHEDGFILNPELWDERFYDYDYIGAPWEDKVVGNGGFCLESKKMLDAKMKLPYIDLPKIIPSDQWVCRTHRKKLEEAGIKFAPYDLALKFATEKVGHDKKSFGFHGRRNAVDKYNEGWKKIESTKLQIPDTRPSELWPNIPKVDATYTFDPKPEAKRRFCVLTGHLDNYNSLASLTIYNNKMEYCLRHGYDMHVHRVIRKEYQDPKTHAAGFSWSRLAEMRRILRSGVYDWVWCVGCDTLITNLTTPLDAMVDPAESPDAEKRPLPEWVGIPNSPAPPCVMHWKPTPGHVRHGRKHLIICGERATPMQADSFLIRSSQEGVAYVDDILKQYDAYKHHPWVENMAMIDLREKHAAITYNIAQWRLNCVDYSRWYNLRPEYKDNTDCFGNRGNWQKGDFLIHWPAASLSQRMEWHRQYSPLIVQ
jgi:hypothetical protein